MLIFFGKVSIVVAGGCGGFRLSANASREGRRGPDRDDAVCLSAS